MHYAPTVRVGHLIGKKEMLDQSWQRFVGFFLNAGFFLGFARISALRRSSTARRSCILPGCTKPSASCSSFLVVARVVPRLVAATV